MLGLVVQSEGLRRSSSGLITGPIYFILDGHSFPEVGWDDFVVTILGWWLDAITRIVRGLSKRERLRFMDGPPIVEFAVGSDGDIAVSLLRDDTRRTPMQAGRTSRVELARAFLTAGDAVVKACQANGWSDADGVDLLEDKVEILRIAAADLGKAANVG